MQPAGSIIIAEFTENSIACTQSDIIYSMTATSNDTSIDPSNYISFDNTTLVVSWIWDAVTNPVTFTITI